MLRCILIVAASVVLVTGCQKKPEPNGIDVWQFEKTTLADAQKAGRCQKQDELTWCFIARQVGIGSQPAQVSLYFQGHEPAAPLIEISLSVRACRGNEVSAGLLKALGEPTVQKGDLALWEKKLMVAYADLDASDRMCEVNFVTPKDAERVAALQKKVAPD